MKSLLVLISIILSVSLYAEDNTADSYAYDNVTSLEIKFEGWPHPKHNMVSCAYAKYHLYNFLRVIGVTSLNITCSEAIFGAPENPLRPLILRANYSLVPVSSQVTLEYSGKLSFQKECVFLEVLADTLYANVPNPRQKRLQSVSRGCSQFLSSYPNKFWYTFYRD